MSQRQRNNKGSGKPYPNRNRRGKKSGAKTWNSESMPKDAFKDGSFSSATNDWRWYATNEQLVRDSASYPFGFALGSKIQFGLYGAEATKYAIPGICSLAFAPTVGYSDNTNSPVNVASRKIYTDIRKNNAGATNYDPVDMMIYLIAMDSGYFMLEHYKRAYGVARSVSPVNRYYPRVLVEAMGFDYDSLVSNLDDFRAMINTYAQKLKALVIPNGMSYMAKHQWLCSGVYQDRPNDKSQLYVFIPDSYYTFELDHSGAGMLLGHTWGRVNFTQAKAVLDSIINPILANQDFAIMSGDILKWRGNGGIVVPTGITETYQIFATYDESVLDQIQNATLVGEPLMYTGSLPYNPANFPAAMQIYQDANKEYLVSTPYFQHPWKFNTGSNPNPGRNIYMSKRLVNFTHGEVQPQEVMEATRLTNIGNYEKTTSTGYDQFSFPTMSSEVLVDAYFWYFKLDNNGVWDYHSWRVKSISDVFVLGIGSNGSTQSEFDFNANELKDFITEMNFISNFNRHPFIVFSAGIQDDDSTLNSVYAPWTGYNGDIDYYTVVDEQDLVQMSEVALLSEFNVRIET